MWLVEALLGPVVYLSVCSSHFSSPFVARVGQNDKDGGRVCAIVKRLLQVAANAQASFTAAALYIVSEVVQRRIEVRRLVLKPESFSRSASDAAGKHAALSREERMAGVKKTGQADGAGGDGKHGDVTAYDADKRDPRYAGAGKSCLWELASLAAHYHPSVRKFAEHVMMNPKHPLNYDGDPLMDFTVRQGRLRVRVCVTAHGIHVGGR